MKNKREKTIEKDPQLSQILKLPDFKITMVNMFKKIEEKMENFT